MGLFENIHKHQEQFAPYGDDYECQGYACDCFNSIHDIEYRLCGAESDSRPEWPSFGGVVVHW